MSGQKERHGSKRVVDEEGTVDQKVKQRIIRARDRVSERRDTIFVQAPLESPNYTKENLVELWKVSVRQYLTRIEPLLRSDEIRGAREFYEEKPIKEKRQILPDDGETPVYHGGKPTTKNIPWSLFYSDNIPTRHIIQEHPVFSPGFTPPEPKQHIVKGLKGVIENHEKIAQWEVVLNPDGWGMDRMIAKPQKRSTLTERDLEKAVRIADEFLQDKAGIGVEIGHQQADEQDDNPF